jgi:chaperone required for assembly of F1-ATPase
VTEATGNGSKATGKAKVASPLRKRFYAAATIAPPDAGSADGWRVLLDGKAMRTPAKSLLTLPARALAEAIAAEWEAQGEHVDPATMPLTRLANSAIDGVRGREAAVREDIVSYAGSDLVCYRAPEPEALARQQAEQWDPILAWSRETLGATFVVAEGIMPVVQPDAAKAAVARALVGYDAFALAALHVMTTLTGSALLALAHALGRLGLEQGWEAAHIDEDWQISTWGEDELAQARRERRRLDMQAASRMLELLRVA